MLRAGYQRFIVDPGVRQAYFPETAKKLYTDQVHTYQTLIQSCRPQHKHVDTLHLPFWDQGGSLECLCKLSARGQCLHSRTFAKHIMYCVLMQTKDGRAF